MYKHFYNLIKNMPLAEEAYFIFQQYNSWSNFNKRNVSDAPTSIMIEITNQCNLDCIMCATQKGTRKKGNMDLSLYKEIILQASAIGVKVATLHTIGEALLHPDVVEMIGFATEKGLITNITTNGQLLTEEKSRKLLEAGLRTLRVSVEGATEETYSKIRRGGSLEKLINNLRTFKRIKEEKRYNVNIIINSILMKENEQEIAAFYKLFVPMVDTPNNIFFNNLGDLGGKIDMEKYALEKPNYRIKNPCRTLWSVLHVQWDGNVSACCVDFDGKLIIGDLQNKSLKEIWEGNQLQQFRKYHLERTPEKMPLCENCSTIRVRMLDEYRMYKFNQKWRKNYLNHK